MSGRHCENPQIVQILRWRQNQVKAQENISLTPPSHCFFTSLAISRLQGLFQQNKIKDKKNLNTSWQFPINYKENTCAGK